MGDGEGRDGRGAIICTNEFSCFGLNWQLTCNGWYQNKNQPKKKNLFRPNLKTIKTKEPPPTTTTLTFICIMSFLASCALYKLAGVEKLKFNAIPQDNAWEILTIRSLCLSGRLRYLSLALCVCVWVFINFHKKLRKITNIRFFFSVWLSLRISSGKKGVRSWGDSRMEWETKDHDYFVSQKVHEF